MMNIAIDGPVGAGKSTIAKAVAKALDILYLDTGAMYRALGLKAVREGVSLDDVPAVLELLKRTEVRVTYENGAMYIYLDGENVGDKIRTPEISMAASDISKIREVRLYLVEMQRAIAAENDVVLDGRDIGTFVLPDSKCKIYLTADALIRAKRRHAELVLKTPEVTLQEVYDDLVRRDYNDMNRDFAPLKKAQDAVEVDSSMLTIEEVVEKIVRYATEVYAENVL